MSVINTENKVVKLSYLSEHIVMIAMEDRESKNTFSHALVKDLLQTFDKINNDPQIKTAVIHGYDNYFCCGGTKEELYELYTGKKVFTDYGSYRVFLDCPIPIIAAMQGHTLGGGLSFSAYADIMVLAEEAYFSANFMKYGFTPGFGATYLIPKKFGISAAEIMLLGAKNYQGLQLKTWGIPAIYTNKDKVIDTAVQLAQQIAKRSRDELISLKRQLTRADKLAMSNIIQQEVVMHIQSFKHPEVRNKIAELFIDQK